MSWINRFRGSGASGSENKSQDGPSTMGSLIRGFKEKYLSGSRTSLSITPPESDEAWTRKNRRTDLLADDDKPMMFLPGRNSTELPDTLTGVRPDHRSLRGVKFAGELSDSSDSSVSIYNKKSVKADLHGNTQIGRKEGETLSGLETGASEQVLDNVAACHEYIKAAHHLTQACNSLGAEINAASVPCSMQKSHFPSENAQSTGEILPTPGNLSVSHTNPTHLDSVGSQAGSIGSQENEGAGFGSSENQLNDLSEVDENLEQRLPANPLPPVPNVVMPETSQLPPRSSGHSTGIAFENCNPPGPDFWPESGVPQPVSEQARYAGFRAAPPAHNLPLTGPVFAKSYPTTMSEHPRAPVTAAREAAQRHPNPLPPHISHETNHTVPTARETAQRHPNPLPQHIAHETSQPVTAAREAAQRYPNSRPLPTGTYKPLQMSNLTANTRPCARQDQNPYAICTRSIFILP